MKSKYDLSGLIGYGILVSYWLFMLIFGGFMCGIRWQEYMTTGTTSNSMGLGLLIFITICFGLAVIMVSFGVWYYITQIILYNKDKRRQYEDGRI